MSTNTRGDVVASESTKSRKHKHQSRSETNRDRSPRSSSRSRSRSRSRSKRKHKDKTHKHKHEKRKRRRSRSRSVSSCSSSSSSSSSDERTHKKKKKSKHEHGHKSDKKNKSSSSSSKHRHKHKHHEKDKEKKSKKKHKHKHKKDKTEKHDKKSKSKSKVAKPENKFGAHGIITMNDLFGKMPEFTSWLIDVRDVCMDELSKKEENRWFAQFCDDWNTSTMPDDKYYDLDKWNRANGGGDVHTVHSEGGYGGMGMARFALSDEAQLSAQTKQKRQFEEEQRTIARVQTMKKQLIDLKSRDQRGFNILNDQYVPTQETFASLARKREHNKNEERIKRLGKYNTNYTLD